MGYNLFTESLPAAQGSGTCQRGLLNRCTPKVFRLRSENGRQKKGQVIPCCM
ncbi:MAG TPA: hypothetical protein H9753_08185 [Candidatus Blautia merdavium]|uniref:Uncharacterized protein n=1 Tax=Candidatus Blautia merdavium TaxID=2838494 RepID=A0A9D2TAR5_9FIRM|nr:hypothetical protein [Candidatus Blautia merdavium]